MIGKNTNNQEKKRMKKNFAFIISNFCFSSINMIEKLIDFSDINFDILHYLIIHFISDIYILCITNNISFDKIKALIDDGCMIIFDYLTISREECLNTSSYKIKYNDAIHFAYQKILIRINNIVKENGQIPNNLKPMTTNKNLNLTIDGIHLIKAIFCCLFKLQFLKGNFFILNYIDIASYQAKLHNISKTDNLRLGDTVCTGLQAPKSNSTATGVTLNSHSRHSMDLEFSVSGTVNSKTLDSQVNTVFCNAKDILPTDSLHNKGYNDNLYCKKVNKIHNKVNSMLFYNIDIIEKFITTLLPEILTCIKSTHYTTSAYNMYICYLVEYIKNNVAQLNNFELNKTGTIHRTIPLTLNSTGTGLEFSVSGTKKNINTAVLHRNCSPAQTIISNDLISFIVIMALLKNKNTEYGPYTTVIKKYIMKLNEILCEHTIRTIFNCQKDKITIEQFFNSNILTELNA